MKGKDKITSGHPYISTKKVVLSILFSSLSLKIQKNNAKVGTQTSRKFVCTCASKMSHANWGGIHVTRVYKSAQEI